MKFLIVFIVLLSFASSYAAIERNSLSCSQNGLLIIHINGISTTSKDAKANAEYIADMLRSHASKLDVSPDPSRFNVIDKYNNSEKFLGDAIQLLHQKLGESDKGLVEIASLVWAFFEYRILLTDVLDSRVIEELDRISIEQSMKQENISNSDIAEMTDSVVKALGANKKVILVPHSQGNLYADYVYDALVEKGLRNEVDKYVGVLHIGSVIKKSKFKNSRTYTLQEDRALGTLVALGFPVEDGKYSTLDGPHRCSDYTICHGVRGAYLNNTIAVRGPKQGIGLSEIRLASQTFIDLIEEVAWMLDNNDPACCEKENGRFYRASYDSSVQDTFIADTVEFSVPGIYDFQNSKICGGTKILGDVRIHDSTVKGQNTLDGSSYASSIEDSHLDGTNTISGHHKIKHAQIYGNGSYMCSGSTSSSYCTLEGKYLEPIFLSENHFNGHYSLVRSNSHSNEINADLIVRINDSTLGTNNVFKGSVEVFYSRIRSGVTLWGIPPEPDYWCLDGLGVQLSQGPDIDGPSTVLKGSLRVEGNTKIFNDVNIEITEDRPDNLCQSRIQASNLRNGTNITGSLEAVGADLDGVSFTGHMRCSLIEPCGPW